MTLVPHDSSPTHTEGLSGHSSLLSSPLQPGDFVLHLGLLRPASVSRQALPSRVHIPYPWCVPGPGRPLSLQTVSPQSHLPGHLFFLLLPGILLGASSGWHQRQSHCVAEEAPLLLFLGIIPLLSPLQGLLCRGDRECMSVPPGPLV